MAQHFLHPIDLRNDRRVLFLRMLEGFKGYGIFMMLLEHIAASPTMEIFLDDKERQIMQADFAVEAWEDVQRVIESGVRAKLFVVRADEHMRAGSLFVHSPLLDELWPKNKLRTEYYKEYNAKRKAQQMEMQQALEKKNKPPKEPKPPKEKIKAPEIIKVVVKQPPKEEPEPVKPKKEEQPKLLDVPPKEHKLQVWVKKNCPNIVRCIPKQLTYEQCQDIQEKYPDPNFVKEVFESLENRNPALLKIYGYVSMTFYKWAAKQMEMKASVKRMEDERIKGRQGQPVNDNLPQYKKFEQD